MPRAGTRLRAPQPSDNCVFLLGAGFSAACKLPVMREFMRTAVRLFFGNCDAPHFDLGPDYQALLDFFAECRQSTWALTRQWGNIEELFTQADMRRLARLPTARKADALCRAIAWVIWDTYRQSPCPDFIPNMKNTCEAVKRSNLRPVIVTTNYDTVCEHTLKLELQDLRMLKQPPGLHYAYVGFRFPQLLQPPPGEPSPLMRVPQDTRMDLARIQEMTVHYWPADAALLNHVVPVIKLHGSVNWFRLGSKRWFASHLCGQNTIGNDIGGEHLGKGSLVAMLGLSQGETMAIEPGIVAPALNKDTSSELIGAQLAAAIEALRCAREVWVIGYSFPATDVFMTRLLTEGLRNNVDLHRLYIIDRRPRSEWRDFIDKTLGSILRDSHFSFFQLDTETALPIMGGDHSNWEEALRNASRVYSERQSAQMRSKE